VSESMGVGLGANLPCDVICCHLLWVNGERREEERRERGRLEGERREGERREGELATAAAFSFAVS